MKIDFTKNGGVFTVSLDGRLDTTTAPELDKLALQHEKIYPIASRCGVFAKTDILPLLNEGCAREDIAASIFQAVVEQAVSGLACGRVIQGKVAFLGGPLAFLTSLRRRFVETLELTEENAVFPQHAEYFVAMGTALHSLHRHEIPGLEQQVGERVWTAEELSALADDMTSTAHAPHEESLPPLFEDAAELRDFRTRHASHTAPRVRLDELEGSPSAPAKLYLGIDAGSTTMKGAIIGESGELLRTWYASNRGDVLGTARALMDDFYAAIPALREKCGDRAVMRAIHEYNENRRVPQQVAALEKGDFDTFLRLTKESGFSSWMYLQNVIPAGYVSQQAMAVALGLCEHYLMGRGAYRVHGGGFAGTVQAFVPYDILDSFVKGIDAALGEGACHVLSIRPHGGVEMEVEA